MMMMMILYPTVSFDLPRLVNHHQRVISVNLLLLNAAQFQPNLPHPVQHHD
jgi:hypothetical protein